MEIKSFQDLYIAELQELRNGEAQLIDALEHMAGTAGNGELKQAFTHHRDQTLAQKERLDLILQRHGADPHAHQDQAMQALVREAEKMMVIVTGNDLRDVALVASAQKLEHYEIAAYGTAAALAGQLDLRDDQSILHQTLEEEKHADALLSNLAKRIVNPSASLAA